MSSRIHLPLVTLNGFAIAGYVATSRLTDNRHFASDVLFGSALGMASGWTVVGRPRVLPTGAH